MKWVISTILWRNQLIYHNRHTHSERMAVLRECIHIWTSEGKGYLPNAWSTLRKTLSSNGINDAWRHSNHVLRPCRFAAWTKRRGWLTISQTSYSAACVRCHRPFHAPANIACHAADPHVWWDRSLRSRDSCRSHSVSSCIAPRMLSLLFRLNGIFQITIRPCLFRTSQICIY